MVRFTCGERKICSTIKKSQNIMNVIVGTKFQLKLTNFDFWTKETKKGISNLKKNKMKNTIEFYIFDKQFCFFETNLP